MVSVFCALVNDGSVFAVDIDARQTVNNLKVLIKECLELRCPAHSLALYLTKHVDGHGKDAWLDSSHEDVAKLETGEIAQTIAALMVNKMDLAYGINDYFDERTPEKKDDNGSTQNWLNQFRATDMNWPSLPKVADLPGFVQSQLAVPIGVREPQLKRMSTMLNPKDPVLLAKLFECTDSSPCIDLYDNVLKRIIDPVRTGTTETRSFRFGTT